MKTWTVGKESPRVTLRGFACAVAALCIVFGAALVFGEAFGRGRSESFLRQEAWQLLDRGSHAEATALLDRAVELDHDRLDSAFWRAYCRAEQGDVQGSREDLRTAKKTLAELARKVQPLKSSYYGGLSSVIEAVIALREGRLAEALDWAEDAVISTSDEAVFRVKRLAREVLLRVASAHPAGHPVRQNWVERLPYRRGSPDHWNSRMQLAQVLEANGRYDEAQEMRALALAWGAMGLPGQGLGIGVQVPRDLPTGRDRTLLHGHDEYQRIRAILEAEQDEQFLDQLSPEISRFPELPPAFRNSPQALFFGPPAPGAAPELRALVRRLEQRTKTHPEDAAAHFLLGCALRFQGQFDEALEEFLEAQRRLPKANGFLAVLQFLTAQFSGRADVAGGHLGRALEVLKARSKEAPGYALLLFEMLGAWVVPGSLEDERIYEALKVSEEAVGFHPLYCVIAGRMALSRGKLQEARTLLERGSGVPGERSVRAKLYLALCLGRLGERDRAQKLLVEIGQGYLPGPLRMELERVRAEIMGPR